MSRVTAPAAHEITHVKHLELCLVPRALSMPPTVSPGPGAGLCDRHWLREGEELFHVGELKEEGS